MALIHTLWGTFSDYKYSLAYEPHKMQKVKKPWWLSTTKSRTIWGPVTIPNKFPASKRKKRIESWLSSGVVGRFGKRDDFIFHTVWGVFGPGRKESSGPIQHSPIYSVMTIWGNLPLYKWPHARSGTGKNWCLRDDRGRRRQRKHTEEQSPSFDNIVRAYEESR